MKLDIKPEMLKEIAEELETGMICFYHKTTGELVSYPDEMRMPGYDEEPWQEYIDKVDENYWDYIRIENVDSREGFKLIERFIDDIDHIPTHNKFINAISRKKPFANFNSLLHDYPELQKQWFAYKTEQYIIHVKEQIEFAR